MPSYTLGTASAPAAAKLDALQQFARQQQVQVFNASDARNRMLFFAFDGTGNNKDDPSLGLPTNVAHLYNAAEVGLKEGGTGKAFYYRGPGTQDNAAAWLIDTATGSTVPQTVKTAYDDLVLYANQHPNEHITIGTTGFSRGAATARAFLNTVWDNGIPDTSSRVSLGINPITNQEHFGYTRYLVPPKTADLGIAMLYDTVATGVARQESLQSIPPAPGLQVYQIYAEDEHRSAFALDSIVDPTNPGDPRMHEWGSPGAHSDIAGFYVENGIALRTLDAGRNLLKNSGVPVAELPAALQYNGQPLTIHDSFKGMYGPDAGPQSGGYVSEPRLQNARTYDNPGALTGRSLQSFDDGSRIETLTYADGSKEVINRNGVWQAVRSTTSAYNSDGSVHSRDVALPQVDGSLTTEHYNGSGVLQSSTNSRTFDDGSHLDTITTPDGTETINAYDIDGELSGRSKTLDSAGGAPTTDSLANMLQSLRNATGDMDDLVLDAAELRTLSGSQAEGEAWGGARLLTLGDSVLGDYYRHHHDIQTGAAIPLLLDDPQTQGLGLLGGFDLSNGARARANTAAPTLIHPRENSYARH